MKLLITYLLIFFLAACVKDGKDENDVLKGDSHIYGRVTYIDSYNGPGDEKIAAGRRVYISYTPTDSSSYIYYVKTDAQGYFSFERLDNKTSYDLFFIDSIDKVQYSAYHTITTPNDSVFIVAKNDTLRQNGILIRVTDTNNEFVADAAVGLYNNDQIFQADTSNTLAIVKATTDMYGRAVFYNLKSGKYYVRGKISYATKKITADAVIQFGGKGIRDYSLVLQPIQQIAEDSLIVKTVDEQGNILPGVGFCVFNNPLLFNTNNCDGNILSSTTNTAGVKNIKDLTAGTYHLLAQGKFQDVSYKGTSTVTLDGVTAKTVTVTLSRITASNVLGISVRDEAQSPVNGTDLYVFTSRVLFLADTTATTLGYIHTTKTNDFGKGSFQNLEAGKYFIRAKAHYGNLLLIGGDTVNVNQTSNIERLIIVK